MKLSAFLRLVSHWLGEAISLLMVGMVVIWFTIIFAVLPIIGLVTGDLYLPGRWSGGGIDVYGTWSRLISAGLLIFFACGAWSFFTSLLTRLREFRATHGRAAMVGVWIAVTVVASLLGLLILGVIVGDNS